MTRRAARSRPPARRRSSRTAIGRGRCSITQCRSACWRAAPSWCAGRAAPFPLPGGAARSGSAIGVASDSSDSHAGGVPKGYVPRTTTGVPGVVTLRFVASSFHCSPPRTRGRARPRVLGGEQWKLDATKRKVTTPGTPVVVLGTYPFGTPPAWLSLESLATPIALPDLAAPPGNGNGAARPAHQLGAALQHADRH